MLNWSLRLYTVPLGPCFGTLCISETSLRLYPVPPVSEKEVITYCEQHWLKSAYESTQLCLSNILVLDAASGKIKTKPVFLHNPLIDTLLLLYTHKSCAHMLKEPKSCVLAYIIWFVCLFCCFTFQSTAMANTGRSVHLATVNQYFGHILSLVIDNNPS